MSSKLLATEASWRAGWDPDDNTKDYDGKAVFYHRKHPKYLRWINERQRQDNPFLSSCLCGPPLGKEPDRNVPNPYYTPARSARAVFTSESGSSYLGEEEEQVENFKNFDIQEIEELKETFQRVFEAVQEENDPYGSIPIEHAIPIARYLGALSDPEKEQQWLAGHDNNFVDLYEVADLLHATQNRDTPDKLAQAFTEVTSKNGEASVTAVQVVLELFGDTPLTKDDAEWVANYVSKGNKYPLDIAANFLVTGNPHYLANKTGADVGKIPVS